MCVLCLQTSGDNFNFSEAVYRVFDGVRRSFTDEQPHRQTKVAQNKKKTTTRSMQNQVWFVHCMRMDIMHEFCIFNSTPVARST